MARSLLLVSPREPSGVTWLINCLLELGIRVHRDSRLPMWRSTAEGWALAPHEEILKKWLPSLSLRERFRFHDGIDVRWTHEWPATGTSRRDVLLFVRDPRDALLSRFKRENCALDFAEFVAFPDPSSLLDKVDNWLLFLRCWLACASVRVLRFEDYKRDARATLSQALAVVGIQPGAGDVARAIDASTFDRAAAAERAYHAAHPEDREVINRQGVPGEWRGHREYEAQMRRIEERCAGLMRDLGYSPAAGLEGEEPGFLPHTQRLSFFGSIPADILRRAANHPADGHGLVARTIACAAAMNRDLVTRAALPSHEQAALAASLDEYLAGVADGTADNLRAAGLDAAAFDWRRPLASARAMVGRLGKRMR